MLTFPIEVDSGRVTEPVNVGEASGALSASEFVIVVEKLASEPSAVASSANELRAPGAAPTKASV